jgi:hypothetical protein
MAERNRLVQRVIRQAHELAAELAYGQIVLVVHQGRVTRAEVCQNYLPECRMEDQSAPGRANC